MNDFMKSECRIKTQLGKHINLYIRSAYQRE